MRPTPSQVRDYYSLKNQEAHLQRALACKQAANLGYPSYVSNAIIFHRASSIVLSMTDVSNFILEAG